MNLASWVCEGCLTSRNTHCFITKALSALVPGTVMKLHGCDNRGRIPVKTCTKRTCSLFFIIYAWIGYVDLTHKKGLPITMRRVLKHA